MISGSNQISKITFICIALFTFACHHHDNAKDTEAEKFKGFLHQWVVDDSVPIPALKKYTILGDSDYKGSHAFRLDTVYYPASKHPLVIISGDNMGVCAFRYLLVFDALKLKNTSVMKVASSCDTDGDEPQNNLDFKIVSSSSYYTEDIYFRATDSTEDSRVIGKHYFKISEEGKILPVEKRNF